MRIAFIYHQFVPKGGMEGYLMEFASRLCQQGHELLLVTAEADPDLVKKIQAEVRLIPVVKGSSLLRMWQFERAVSQLTDAELGVDVSIGSGRTTTHDLHRAGGGCHAIYSRLLPPWKRWSLKNQLELHLEKQLYTSGRTKLYVVNSAQVAAQLHSVYGTPRDQFRVIHTAVDTERFKPAGQNRDAYREKICAKLKADHTRPIFLFVSLNHRRKGLDALLEAWEEVDADLWIVGKPLDTRYRLQLAKYNLMGRVFAMDARSDVGLLYQVADWFIHPTQYDACANTVLQSMASGLPGLISLNDGAVDLLKHEHNGRLLAKPQDAAVLFEDIQTALDTEESERLRMGQNARATVLPLTWDAHIQKWQNAFAELGK